MITRQLRWFRLHGSLTPALVAHLIGYFAISSLCIPSAPVFCQDQLLSSTYDRVTEAFRQGKLAEAEQTLRSIIAGGIRWGGRAAKVYSAACCF